MVITGTDIGLVNTAMVDSGDQSLTLRLVSVAVIADLLMSVVIDIVAVTLLHEFDHSQLRLSQISSISGSFHGSSIISLTAG